MTDADGANWPPLKPMSQRAPRSAMPVVKVGDRIRVSDEGTVERMTPLTGGPGYRLTVKRSNGRRGYVCIRPNMTSTVEVVAPAYVDGGIYIDADDDVFKFNAAELSWHEFDTSTRSFATLSNTFDFPNRPITRLDA